MKLNILEKFFKKGGAREKLEFETPEITIKDIIAPPYISISQNYLKIEERLSKSFFVFSYPRYLFTGWLTPIINLTFPLDISFHIHPVDTGKILAQLRRKLTEIEAEIEERREKGLIRDPVLETAFHDIEDLRDNLQTAKERVFNLGIYITIFAASENQLKEMETVLRAILEARLIYIKPMILQHHKGFIATAPYGLDVLDINTPMNTAPLSSIFPFVSPDLSANEGILYGINRHNNSLVLFDRFTLENGNMVVFAKSGSGKSYFCKIEILRYLMQGVDIIVLDPENEYKMLAESVGGSYFDVSLTSPNHFNPFDLPEIGVDENPEDILRSNIINLVGLLRIMLGGLTPQEDAILDHALTEVYAARDITPNSDPKNWKQNIPRMQDLQSVLEGMEGTESLVERLRKYTTGTYAPFFNNYSNIQMNNNFICFGIKNMETDLRPAALYIILRYIWNIVRSESKKRILLIDEAWWIIQTEDGASFLYGMCKRGRKYWLGITTITQDVSDFMKSYYGKPIITNSSLQFLMKQSPATIDVVKKTFNLTEEEKFLLLECNVGEGIFIAGQKRVAIRVVASYVEDQIINTSPERMKAIEEAKKKLNSTK